MRRCSYASLGSRTGCRHELGRRTGEDYAHVAYERLDREPESQMAHSAGSDGQREHADPGRGGDQCRRAWRPWHVGPERRAGRAAHCRVPPAKRRQSQRQLPDLARPALRARDQRGDAAASAGPIRRPRFGASARTGGRCQRCRRRARRGAAGHEAGDGELSLRITGARRSSALSNPQGSLFCRAPRQSRKRDCSSRGVSTRSSRRAPRPAAIAPLLPAST